jgi:polyphosphate kinase 2 (PPK2 family)
MIHRTSTAIAPWTLVPANDKKHARVTILESCIEQLRRGLKRKDSRLRKSL